MNKKIIYEFKGALQDITKSKHPFQYYFEGQHIKILATDSQSTGSTTNEKGNELVITIPNITITENISAISYGTSTLFYNSSNEITSQISSGDLPTTSTTQIIIGHIETRNGIALWTTDSFGMDCIWLLDNVLEDSYDLSLLYVRSLGFSSSSPIQAIFNYENEDIQKVYWVDGAHQVRFLNLTHNNIEENESLIDIPLNTLNFVGNVTFSQPIVTNILSGGAHTAGMIQYAYNLFRLNSSQTKLSPLSELVSLDKGNTLGGGELNEIVSATPEIVISNIDSSYSNIRVYAIKYTSFNELPSVDLIDERNLGSTTSITIYDDGSTISSLSLTEFLFLGSNPIIPKHIESKDNRLFLANIKDKSFELPDDLDCRAYGFGSNSTTTTVWENPQLNSIGNVNTTINFLTVDNNYNIPLRYDSINLKYSTLKYQYNSTVIGGTGKYLQYELVTKTSSQLTKSSDEYRFFKDEELYRIGIEFFNKLGQTSPPKWIADFKAPEGNLQGNFNTLKVELLPAFYTWLNTYTFTSDDQKPTGYKIIRADRTSADRTILCQGSLTQMMCQTNSDVSNYSYWEIEENRRVESDSLVKFPIPVSRGFSNGINPLNKTNHLEMMNEQSNYGSDTGEFPNEEIYSGTALSTKRQQSWQYTKLFQMNSPEILFDSGLGFGSGLRLTVKGIVKSTKNNIWYKRINITNESEIMSRNHEGVNSFMDDSDIRFLALFGPSDRDYQMDFTLINREYLTFVPSSANFEFDIYGVPEITERGQGPTSYNGDSTLKYQNTMNGFKTDESDDIPAEAAIVSMNSHGNKCLTIAEGVATVPSLEYRRGIEEIHSDIGIGESDGLLLAEIKVTDQILYLGNLYGGNSYEDKTKTTYLEIGVYSDIAITSIQIDNPGDTYIYNYKHARICKTDTEELDDQVLQLTEIIEYPVESSVDLKNRNDKSLFEWDSEFQPTYNSFHEYNRVYSQQPTLVGNTSIDFTFRKIKSFDTRIQATKLKIPNETVDSWTDILENEVSDLDGKYGPINAIVAYKDTMFSFQDESIAQISINPRIQVQGSDGIALELGTGGILYDYNYITTKSGSINKWSVIPTKKGIYYYDALNKAIGRVPDMVTKLLTDVKGMHSYFNNNFDYNSIKIDNPILNSGVIFGYDNYNNDVYFTLLQGSKSFTWCFNELNDEFIDLKTYKPSRYINKGEKLIIPSTTNNTLYEQYKGEYNKFFGVYQPSYIILQVNPEANIDTIFNTIEFKSELYLNDIDQPDKTITHIQAYNEYQDSGRIPLIVGRGSNLRRKFREWKADIPRQNRNRIRNPWIYLKLELTNTSDYKMILHSIIVNYTI